MARQATVVEPLAAAAIDGDRQIIGRTLLFENVPAEGLREVLRVAHERAVRKGEFCFLQGERAETMYVLLSGAIKLIRCGADGRQVIVHLVKPLEPFGHVGMLDGGTHLVSAQAAHDSRMLAWEPQRIHRLMHEYPAIEANCLRLLAIRIEEEWERLHDLLAARIEQRVARTLLWLAHRSGNTGQPQGTVVWLSHQDLADFTGTNVYTVSRILSRWKRSRAVDVCRGRILIRSLPRLEQIAGEPGRLTETSQGTLERAVV